MRLYKGFFSWMAFAFLRQESLVTIVPCGGYLQYFLACLVRTEGFHKAILHWILRVKDRFRRDFFLKIFSSDFFLQDSNEK